MAIAIHQSLTNYRATPRAAITGLMEGIVRTLKLWRSRIRERRAFASFEYRDLHDMGVSRWDLERELAKPFWRG